LPAESIVDRGLSFCWWVCIDNLQKLLLTVDCLLVDD